MATIAFIPARCGSKSVKLKNIKNFCGKPLIYWTLKALQDAKKVEKIFVATDCKEISDTVKSFNLNKVNIYNRNKENAQDESSTESVMTEFIRNNNINGENTFILAQATSPLTQSADFDKALEKYETEDTDSLLSCVRIKRFFWNENGTPLNYDFKNRPRRQEFKGTLVENGAFYINKVKNIIKYNNRLSGKIGFYIMPEYSFIEIDEESDWLSAENLMKRYIPKKVNKKNIKLFLTDVDGVLTDAGMYYSENGDELKKFNTKDGMGFKLLKEAGIKTGIITSENREINKNRAKKLNLDYIFQGTKDKLSVVKKLCGEININLNQVAYIGDDINDYELLSNAGLSACPNDANDKIKDIYGIIILKNEGGKGAVREFIESYII